MDHVRLALWPYRGASRISPFRADLSLGAIGLQLLELQFHLIEFAAASADCPQRSRRAFAMASLN